MIVQLSQYCKSGLTSFLSLFKSSNLTWSDQWSCSMSTLLQEQDMALLNDTYDKMRKAQQWWNITNFKVRLLRKSKMCKKTGIHDVLVVKWSLANLPSFSILFLWPWTVCMWQTILLLLLCSACSTKQLYSLGVSNLVLSQVKLSMSLWISSLDKLGNSWFLGQRRLLQVHRTYNNL